MAQKTYMGMGIALGTAIGVALGIALDSLALGVGGGIAIGVALGAGFDAERARKDPKDRKDTSLTLPSHRNVLLSYTAHTCTSTNACYKLPYKTSISEPTRY